MIFLQGPRADCVCTVGMQERSEREDTGDTAVTDEAVAVPGRGEAEAERAAVPGRGEAGAGRTPAVPGRGAATAGRGGATSVVAVFEAAAAGSPGALPFRETLERWFG